MLKIKGGVRGNVLNTDAKYVVSKYGEEGLKKLKKEMEKNGIKINYGEIKNTEWCPLGWRAVSLLTIKDLFKWSEEDVFAMGMAAPRNSFLIRTILKYFISLEKTFMELGKYWEKHYSRGKLETKKIDTEKKFLEFYVKDFNLHPCLCTYYKGYFKSLAQLLLRSEDIEIEEPECSFKGDSRHKFIITWR